MDLGLINDLMAYSMRDTGTKISSMVKVKRLGKMEVCFKETINTAKKMDMELFNGQMGILIKDNFKIIIYMVREGITGVTSVNMKDNGSTIKCTGKEFSFGMMVEST